MGNVIIPVYDLENVPSNVSFMAATNCSLGHVTGTQKVGIPGSFSYLVQIYTPSHVYAIQEHDLTLNMC